MMFILPALVVVTMPVLIQDSPKTERVTELAPVKVYAPLDKRDSTRTLKVTRKAQREFETLRRRLLPHQSGLAGRSCDVVVGRYCHWQQEGTGAPPEEPKVIEGRERLLSLLESAGRMLPGDRWILAQKVRYLIEAGRPEAADSVAVACAAGTNTGATRGWCFAFSGYVAQESGNYARADSAFASALAVMPEKERCDWQDLSLILDGKAAGQYKRLNCSARDTMATALWRLVQPLYLTGVNDVRTEFFARVTRMHIEKDTPTPMTTSWGSDDREALIRYGGGLWYTQELSQPGSGRPPVIASHRRGPAFNFFPQSRALASPEQLKPDDWEYDDVISRTRYAPQYVQHFDPLLEHQLAVFRRGDSALIVAAFDASGSGIGSAQLKAGLFAAVLEHGGVSSPMGGPIENPGATAISTMRAPWRPLVVSLEVFDPGNRAAGRTRYSVQPPKSETRLSVSDLLLYTPQDSMPVSLQEAVPLVLRSLRVPGSRRLGLFWETYGVRPDGETYDCALIVEPIGQNWIKRAFIKLRRSEENKPLSLQWREVPAIADGIASRSLTVDLSTLKPGRYRVRLSLIPPGDAPIATQRDVEIM